MSKHVVHKVAVNPHGPTIVPATALILHVDEQHDGIYCWYLVPEHLADGNGLEVPLEVVGTGHVFNAEGMEHLTTVKLQGGNFIFHIFKPVGSRVFAH